MKRILISLLAATALVAVAQEKKPETVVGEKAPAFSLPDIAGKTWTLAEQKDKFVVLEWINVDCPFVKKHYGAGNMQKLQADYAEKGVIWLAINSSAPGKQGHFAPDAWPKLIADRKAVPAAVLLDTDGKVGRLYGAKTTPHMYIIDPKGVLIYAGAIDSNSSADPKTIPDAKNYVREALDAALAGKPVEITTSKPYGCSVKY